MECPSCHATNPSDARFCQKCGADLAPAAAGAAYSTVPPAADYSSVPPVTGYAQPGSGYAAAPPPGAAYGQPAAGAGLSDNAAGALAYVTILPAIIFLLIDPFKNRPFVRFHSVQCLALAAVSVVGHILLAFLPFHLFMLSSIFSLLIFVVWLIAIVQAYQGKWFKLPLIGDFAMQQSRRTAV